MNDEDQRFLESLEVPTDQWIAARERENERYAHPCDCADRGRCMCNGACSCHWMPSKGKP